MPSGLHSLHYVPVVDVYQGRDGSTPAGHFQDLRWQGHARSTRSSILNRQRCCRRKLEHPSTGHHHAHDHHHDHDHGDHVHEARTVVEQNAVDKEGDDSAQRRFPEAFIQVLQQRCHQPVPSQGRCRALHVAECPAARKAHLSICSELCMLHNAQLHARLTSASDLSAISMEEATRALPQLLWLQALALPEIMHGQPRAASSMCSVQSPCEEAGSCSPALQPSVLQLCLGKKLTSAEDLRVAAEQMEARPGLNLGAKLTVKAWTDPAFKVRVLSLHLLFSLPPST